MRHGAAIWAAGNGYSKLFAMVLSWLIFLLKRIGKVDLLKQEI
jgi:hypothetical protein